MASVVTDLPQTNAARTVAEVVHRLGDVPLERIRARPAPGTAVESDVVDTMRIGEMPCELVDGVLVEKAMGLGESMLGAHLVRILGNFIEENDLGLVAGADGTMRLFAGTVRMPDVAFISWKRLPDGFPEEPIPHVVPDLAVEVFSRGNTAAEMDRKLADYFEAGVRLVWIVYPARRIVEAYQSRGEMDVITDEGALAGGDVLPGFELALSELFSLLDRGK